MTDETPSYELLMAQRDRALACLRELFSEEAIQRIVFNGEDSIKVLRERAMTDYIKRKKKEIESDNQTENPE